MRDWSQNDFPREVHTNTVRRLTFQKNAKYYHQHRQRQRDLHHARHRTKYDANVTAKQPNAPAYLNRMHRKRVIKIAEYATLGRDEKAALPKSVGNRNKYLKGGPPHKKKPLPH